MADKRDDDRLDAAIDPEMLAKAEQAVAALSDSFSTAIQNDIGELRERIEALESAAEPANTVSRIFDIAHDLHGQGGSFGYPLISRIGAAMCRFIESRDISVTDGAALRVFADAASAIAAENITGEGDAVSRATVDELEALAARTGS